PGVDGPPAGAPVGALEHAPAGRPRVEGARGLGVNRQGVDRSSFRPVADPRPALGRGSASADRATKNYYDGNEQRPPGTAQQGTQNAGHRSRLLQLGSAGSPAHREVLVLIGYAETG